MGAALLGYGTPLGAVEPPVELPVLTVEEIAHPDGTLPVSIPAPPDGSLRQPDTSPEDGADVEAAVMEPQAGDAAWQTLLKGLAPEQAERARLLMTADQLYQGGDVAAAEALYRQAKDASWQGAEDQTPRILPITDVAELPPAAAVYWREAKAGAEAGLETRMLVPLELLVEEYPQFLPGQALYVEYLLQYGRLQEATAVIEAAVARYPYHPELLKAQTQVLMAQEKWLEAAIAARQFTIFNPDHPETAAMLALSQENADQFRAQMNQQLTGNLLSNIVTGAAGYILTGGLLGPFTALNSSMMLLQGESAVGEQVANQALAQLPIMENQEVNSYVDAIGEKLAALAGRSEFDYDFYVVMDDSLNAFALPGGKIFINAGAIMKTESEAELAGLVGHEISHAALSHGFQMVTQGNLTSSIAAFIPIPEVASIAASLVVSSYSRDMERQADVLGTQILAAGDYAADGLYNLMVTLREEVEGRPGLSWFASHPATDERVSYLERLVDEGGFTRYAYEGVESHLKIRRQVEKLMAQYEAEQERQGSRLSR